MHSIRNLGVTASLVACMIFAGGHVGTAQADPLEDYDQLLQSVEVSLQTDGTISHIRDTRVAFDLEGNQLEAGSGQSTYDPSETASRLPVRVTTSYRWGDRIGTDLADLEGADGLIRINVDVQNLTVSPEEVSFDTNGQRVTRTALVGVPLTVVASTRLTQPAEDVVTGNTQTAQVTNGVVSQSNDGGAVVQWAAILAPPQLPTATRFSLVMNATDFTVPELTIGIQPGYTAEASMNQVLTTAFNPHESSEAVLIEKTIAMVADLDDLLSRTGQTINDARQTLDDSAQTIGTRTVADLTASSEHILASSRTFSAALTGLQTSLDASLTATNSAVLAQLSQTTTSLQGLLGDTTMTVPAPRLSGEGCQVVIEKPEDSTSVYGTLLNVSVQLNGYALATESCKAEVRAEFMASIGPREPDEVSCGGSDSLTCSLFRTRADLSALASNLKNQSGTLVASLAGIDLDGLSTDMADLSLKIGTVSQQVETLSGQTPLADVQSQVDALSLSLTDIQTVLTSVATQTTQVHTAAVAGVQRASDMTTQIDTLQNDICRMTGQGKPLNQDQAEALLKKVTGRSCPTADNPQGNPLPVGTITPLATSASDDSQAWSTLVAMTDPTSQDPESLAMLLADLQTKLDAMSTALTTLSTSTTTLAGDIATARADLSTVVGEVVGAAATVTAKITEIQTQRALVGEGLDSSLNDLGDALQQQIDASFDQSIGSIHDRGEQSADASTALLDKTMTELVASSQGLVATGTEAITQSNEQVVALRDGLGEQTSTMVNNSLTMIDGMVRDSNQDLTASSALLTDDINRVLLDLGSTQGGGTGLLGAMAASSAATTTADLQIADVSSQAVAFGNVQRSNLESRLLRNAQMRASLRKEANQPAFVIETPRNATHTTIYSFTINGH